MCRVLSHEEDIRRLCAGERTMPLAAMVWDERTVWVPEERSMLGWEC
jgi:hypothetical protein